MVTSRRFPRVAAAALVVVALPILAACSGGGGGGGNDKAVNIAYIGYTQPTAYTIAIRNGAESVVKKNGGKVTYFAADFDPQKQISQCQDAIASGRYQAIILSPVDSATGVPCAKAAQKAGIPVGTVETAVGADPFSLKPQVKGVVVVVAAPQASWLEAESQILKLACGTTKPCEVIAEIVSPTDAATAGLVTKLEKQLAGDDIRIVQRITTGYDPGEVVKNLPDALSAHPNATVFMSISDQSAIAGASVIKDAGLANKVVALGLGASSEGIAGVKDGSLLATTSNWPRQYGQALGTGLTQAVEGKKVTNPEIDMYKMSTPMVVTKSNVDSFTPEWGAGTQ
ncbi:MAG TPA: sugar ABC transporter substrate-binding protein [Pseudolysinimonas sp.]|nr:sugar ABC transporter substrate-binding protein [Pseudolysinimonas sp.]